jgi:hypothetical protein
LADPDRNCEYDARDVILLERARAWVVVSVVAAATVAPVPVRADDTKAPVSEADRDKARELYVKGVELVKKAQWSDALAFFEQSSKLYPNPTTTFNVGYCERALGRYVRAHGTLVRALREDETAEAKMPDSTRTEAKAYVDEIDRLVARVTVTLEPRDAAIAVDGRPLAAQASSAGGPPKFAAGVEAPGPGVATGAATFEVIADPGAHVITLSRRGYSDAVVNRSLAPGSRESIELRLDLLPATLRVTSSQNDAIVTVNDKDVGPAPVDVRRPAGTYRVTVTKDGFLPYESQVSVKAGEEVKLRAALSIDEPSILSRWWFWTGAAAVVAGGVVLTYALTRPDPEPPPYDGGTAGWVVHPQMRF